MDDLAYKILIFDFGLPAFQETSIDPFLIFFANKPHMDLPNEQIQHKKAWFQGGCFMGDWIDQS